MPTNFWMFFIAALIPLAVGAFYYNDNVLGNVWKRTNGFTDADLEGGNMAIIFGLSYLLSILIAFALSGMVIHQGGVLQMMMPAIAVSGSEAQQTFNNLMAEYGEYHRSFKHGFIHGSFSAVFFGLPLIGINALFERRGWKYVWIHLGYWFITLGLMGGLLCQTLQYAPLS